VIIPVLNEAETIAAVLSSVQRAGAEIPIEIIVVDGGSSDATVELAKAAGAIVLQTAPGRAKQMNAGAKAASGDILLFLHADTYLPSGFASLVTQTLAKPETVAGAFDLRIAGSHPGLRWIEWGVKWRSRLLQLPYGDQAIFLKAATFEQVNGFAELPIMEDFEFVRRLQTYGKIAIAPAAVTTSGRRWQRLGIVRTTLINQMAIAAYFLGVPLDQIARWYRRAGQKKLTRNRKNRS
jgi:rSAM/selenodomain-associated transferase 2